MLPLAACVAPDGGYDQPGQVYPPPPPQPVYTQEAPQPYAQPQEAPPPQDSSYQQDTSYDATASEPPPPLPVYEQPECPGPGYIWTPGYWGYNGGYYWVPGTWVEPPQPNVYWTPGYWGWSNNVYLFHGGYWGPHVGYYGGVDYGSRLRRQRLRGRSLGRRRVPLQTAP